MSVGVRSAIARKPILYGPRAGTVKPSSKSPHSTLFDVAAGVLSSANHGIHNLRSVVIGRCVGDSDAVVDLRMQAPIAHMRHYAN